MILSPTPGLEGFARRVGCELSDVIGERERLGLSVTRPSSVFVQLYGVRGATAYASLSDEGPVLGMNALPLAMNVLEDEKRADLSGIIGFFDRTREIFGISNENAVLSFIKDPSEFATWFESSCPPEQFERYKAFFTERGKGYDELKDELLAGAEPVRDALEGFVERMGALSDALDLSSLRHEMDHIDFYTAPFYRIFHDLHEAKQQAKNAWSAHRSLPNSRAYAQAAMDSLEMMVRVTPILEARAMFFNEIPLGGWDDADYGSARNRVNSRFINGYVEDLLVEEVTDPLVANAWSYGLMDRQTSNYVFLMVNQQRGNAEAVMRYLVSPEAVDHRVASRILYDELPMWKRALTDTVIDAAEVFAEAYRDDPSRLKRAMVARTPDEYLALSRA